MAVDFQLPWCLPPVWVLLPHQLLGAAQAEATLLAPVMHGDVGEVLGKCGGAEIGSCQVNAMQKKVKGNGFLTCCRVHYAQHGEGVPWDGQR